MSESIIKQIADGRTDLVFDYLAAGHLATSADKDGTSLIKWCAYYGDVSAIRFLLANGESIQSLGDNLDLHTAAFHGHWRLCQFLIEQGADVNKPLTDSGESPLHAALCNTERLTHDLVLKVLLSNGANPNCVTRPGVETSGFMRDCRTKAATVSNLRRGQNVFYNCEFRYYWPKRRMSELGQFRKCSSLDRAQSKQRVPTKSDHLAQTSGESEGGPM